KVRLANGAFVRLIQPLPDCCSLFPWLEVAQSSQAAKHFPGRSAPEEGNIPGKQNPFSDCADVPARLSCRYKVAVPQIQLCQIQDAPSQPEYKARWFFLPRMHRKETPLHPGSGPWRCRVAHQFDATPFGMTGKDRAPRVGV